MLYYEQFKITIDAFDLAEVILNMVVRHYNLADSIVSNQSFIFTARFWSSLCYFLGIKQKLSTTFHSQTDGQTERQNSTMKAYFRTFVS